MILTKMECKKWKLLFFETLPHFQFYWNWELNNKSLDCLGGGGTRALAPSHRPADEFNLPNMGGVCLGRSLIEMAAKGNVDILIHHTNFQLQIDINSKWKQKQILKLIFRENLNRYMLFFQVKLNQQLTYCFRWRWCTVEYSSAYSETCLLLWNVGYIW